MAHAWLKNESYVKTSIIVHLHWLYILTYQRTVSLNKQSIKRWYGIVLMETDQQTRIYQLSVSLKKDAPSSI